MGLNYALLNGASGLRATQTAINTVSHNLANSETPGYSRQRVLTSSQAGEIRNARRGGRGAQIENISRVHDRYVNEQARRDRNLLGFFTSRERALYTLESIYSEDIAPSINSGFDSFFNSLRDLTRDPANRGARSQFLAGTQEIVDVFTNVHEDLRQIQLNIDQDIIGRVEQINHLTSYIAQLNEQVVVANDASMDFEDKRDEAIRQLSDLVSITVVPQASGTIGIHLNGVGTLVQDHLHGELTSLPDTSNRRLIQIGFVGIGATTSRNITELVDEGELGGLLVLRDQNVESLLVEVNSLAQSFANSINAQHEAGFDLNGNPGEPLLLFEDPHGDPASNIRVNQEILDNPDLVAIAASNLVDLDGNISGSPGDALNGIAITELQYLTRSETISYSSVAALPNYTGASEIVGNYNGALGNTHIRLTTINGGAPNATRFRVDGVDFTHPNFEGPSGANGQGYTLAEVNTFLSNPSQFSGVQISLPDDGSTFLPNEVLNVTLSDTSFNRRVAETLQTVGQLSASNIQQVDVYSTRLEQSERLQESVVGVSIDEELLDLTRFEKQFQANGKVIQTVNMLMDSVLELVR